MNRTSWSERLIAWLERTGDMVGTLQSSLATLWKFLRIVMSSRENLSWPTENICTETPWLCLSGSRKCFEHRKQIKTLVLHWCFLAIQFICQPTLKTIQPVILKITKAQNKEWNQINVISSTAFVTTKSSFDYRCFNWVFPKWISLTKNQDSKGSGRVTCNQSGFSQTRWNWQ